MKGFALIVVLLSFLISYSYAGSTGNLELRAYIPPTSITSLKQQQLNSNRSLWIFSNQTNLQHSIETQKFEVEGLDQKGLETHIEKVVTKDRKIQYEILINRLNYSLASDRPIFLKISAN